MKKWSVAMLAYSVLIATTGSLAGCTDNSEPNQTAKATPTISASASPTESATNAQSPKREEEKLDLRIHLNQVGYLPEGAKLAVFAADEAFPEIKVKVAAENQKIVWEGKLSAASLDTHSGDWVSQVDFGSLKTEGKYHLVAAGNESVPLVISKDVYKDLFQKVAHSYTLQRSGEAIDDPVLGLKLPAGHLQDKTATVYFKDDKGKQPIIDVHGGWYDAGDYGKYIPPAAVTVAQLLLAYELRPEFFRESPFLSDNEKADWEQAGEAPDVLTEVKVELDWMLRMQRGEGAVYHKVSGGAFPDFISPAEDVQERTVYGMSSYGTAMFAAATAMGARIYEPFDSVYASELLKHSKKAQAWLDAHPDALYRNDDGQNSGSGPYDKTSDREERFWALAELLKTTGESGYDATIQNEFADLQSKQSSIISWGDGRLLGQWAIVTATKTPSQGKSVASEAILQGAERITAQAGTDGYRSTLSSNEYTWASNKNALAKGEILLLANELKPNIDYVVTATDQLHYILGRNAMGMSYVTGVGTRYPEHPHHRISLSSGILVPGLLVGGPNRNGEDSVLKKIVDQGVAPAKSYIDDLSSYASNEYAIDYNAPLFFTLALLK
jgi:endoglucanase